MCIRDRDGIIDVQSYGDRVDVLVHDARDGERVVRAALAAAAVSVTSIDAEAPTLENVFVARLRELGSAAPYRPLPVTAHPRVEGGALAIDAHALTKQFGSFRAVDNVTLKVGYGEIYGLLGANGAGKTTIIKMLCGLLAPTSGTIALAGQTTDLRAPSLLSLIHIWNARQDDRCASGQRRKPRRNGERPADRHDNGIQSPGGTHDGHASWRPRSRHTALPLA